MGIICPFSAPPLGPPCLTVTTRKFCKVPSNNDRVTFQITRDKAAHPSPSVFSPHLYALNTHTQKCERAQTWRRISTGISDDLFSE